MSVTKKRYFYKVFAPFVSTFWDSAVWDSATWDVVSATPAYITTWSQDVVSEPNFRMVINGGAADMTIRLARPYNNYGEGVDISTNNRVECWMGDTDSPNAKLIYSGYISAYAPTLDGVNQYVDVTLLGFATQMSVLYMQDGAGYTAVQYTNEDVATMIFDLVGKYRSNGGMVSATPQSVDTVGDSGLTYTFNFETYKDGLDAMLGLAPANWYYFIDATNTVQFHQAHMDVADIKATVGRDVVSLSATKRIEQTYDRVYVIGGTPINDIQLFRRYDRTGQIGDSTIGLREAKIQDGRVTDTHTADVMAKRFLDLNQGLETRLTMRIVDSNGQDQALGADIEAIIPGKTIQVINLAYGGKAQTQWDAAVWDSDVWDYPITYSQSAPLVIVSVQYTPDYVDIECSSRLPEVAKQTTSLAKSFHSQINGTLPIIATVGSA